ncbi:MAG TPA: DUF983 domain-containing protein [Thermomicrobiaceae bacterium]|nr:DUF983 domain-containing protein [Thermomicrobiaceae bacterium]
MVRFPSPILILARGFTRRCPRCGDHRIYRRWWAMVGRCPTCGLHFEREEGYWTGAMAIDLVVTEFVFAAALVAVSVATWPNIPMVPLLVAGLLINGVVSVVFYPIAKTIWVAIDLIFHPLEENEVSETERLREIRDRAPVEP